MSTVDIHKFSFGWVTPNATMVLDSKMAWTGGPVSEFGSAHPSPPKPNHHLSSAKGLWGKQEPPGQFFWWTPKTVALNMDCKAVYCTASVGWINKKWVLEKNGTCNYTYTGSGSLWFKQLKAIHHMTKGKKSTDVLLPIYLPNGIPDGVFGFTTN
ncbi:hypothetical protein DSO57_1023616 [Entomophthora muscae]|uniref:Uncharacterized protein n=1 Tax=Entomophthora muscae TaxID=34485 RepID=A0ACC2UDA3_9FUNG|nr:hypothetical protein DSO57_1023616 [Entomophthora muscae]